MQSIPLSSYFPSISSSSLNQGIANLIAQNKSYSTLLQHKRLPDNGWEDLSIQSFLLSLSQLDTNSLKPIANTIDHTSQTTTHPDTTNNPNRWCGVGEREGRVFSTLVMNRHYGFSHGMGRSGDIMEQQPKAAGSSILVQLTTNLVLDAMRRGCGWNGHKGGPACHGFLLPLCTGMSVSLVLTSLRKNLPSMTNSKSSSDIRDSHDDPPCRDIVLWCRMDQKSCFKAVHSAGYTCVVVPTCIEKEEVVTNVTALLTLLQHYGTSRIAAIVTTTSCFAPRIPDPVDVIAKICQENNVPHIINNAYGLQCPKICKLINRACVIGRVDAIVSSMDKNFLVPVGGAIITSPNQTMIENIRQSYAGRASSSPILDLFITLLSMGLNGYQRLLQNRMMLIEQFQKRFHEVATKYGGRILSCPRNTISFAITLDHLTSDIIPPSRNTTIVESEHDHSRINQIIELKGLKEKGHDRNETQQNMNLSQKNQTNQECSPNTNMEKMNRERTSYFGSMLFTRCISGTRVIPRNETKVICGHTFEGYGSSTDLYPYSYMAAACAIGLSMPDMNEFFHRLDKCFKDFFLSQQKKRNRELEDMIQEVRIE